MTTPRSRKPKGRAATRPTPEPKHLLPRLQTRLQKERASRERWRQRLFRAARAYERQYRLVARLERRLAQLGSA